jgi:hypothetical protein
LQAVEIIEFYPSQGLTRDDGADVSRETIQLGKK